MVATDTVVGIIGAVVLVAVMAGVFVYEYNNTEGDAGSLEAQQEHFEEDYDGLSATQDMDGDGKPNFNDTDIDGDGIDNGADPMLSVTFAVDTGIAAPTGAATTATYGFQVVNGSEKLEGSLSYTRAAGAQFPSVTAQLTGPAGFDARSISFVQGGGPTGTAFTATVAIDEPLPAGAYTITFTNQGPGGLVPVGQAATVTGSLEVHYATPSDLGNHDSSK